MDAIASQITSLTIVYSTVYSDADQRKHQSSASLAFVRGIHRWPVNSPHKGPVTRKMFPFDHVIMISCVSELAHHHKLRYQLVITSTQDDLLLIGIVGTDFSAIWIKTYNIWIKKYMKMPSNCWLFCFDLRDLNILPLSSIQAGLILGLNPANERRRYNVTPSLIAWAQT